MYKNDKNVGKKSKKGYDYLKLKITWWLKKSENGQESTGDTVQAQKLRYAALH